MKKIFFLILMYPCILTYAQNEKGIKFETGLSWEAIKAKARAENKYIFVDCYTTWCKPCKAMDKYVYERDNVGDYMNARFINVKVQMDTTRQDNEAIKQWYHDAHVIRQQFKVNSFPTFLFFSPDGQLVHKDLGFLGYQEGHVFIALAADACNPDKQYYTLLKKYENGTFDTGYMKYLARKANSLGETELAEKIANNYINLLKEEDLFIFDNIWLMADFTKRPDQRGFAILRDNATRIKQVDPRIIDSRGYAKWIIYNTEMKPYITSKNGKADWQTIEANCKKYGVLGQETYTDFKPGMIFKSEIEPALKADPDWNKIFPLIKKQNAGKGEEYLVGSSIIFYLNGIINYHTEKNCKNLVAAATVYVDNYPSFLSAENLNNWAWTIFERSSRKYELNKALLWSRRAVELASDDPANIDTHANVLYKIGQLQEAITWEEKAVLMEDEIAAKQKRAPNKVFRETFEKMKKGEPTWTLR